MPAILLLLPSLVLFLDLFFVLSHLKKTSKTNTSNRRRAPMHSSPLTPLVPPASAVHRQRTHPLQPCRPTSAVEAQKRTKKAWAKLPPNYDVPASSPFCRRAIVSSQFFAPAPSSVSCTVFNLPTANHTLPRRGPAFSLANGCSSLSKPGPCNQSSQLL